MNSTEVLGFVTRVLEADGAIVQPAGSGCVEALLPAHFRKLLDLDEFVRLRAGAGDGHLCGFGTEILGKIAAAAIGGGRVAAYESLVAACSPREPEHFDGLNVTFRVVQTRSEPAWILSGLGRYVAVSDDERLGTVRAAVAAPGGAAVPAPDISPELFMLRPLASSDVDARVVRELLPPLVSSLRGEVARDLAELRVSVARRRARDAARLKQYFSEMAVDFCRRMRGRREDTFRNKLEALPEEMERRMAQLKSECMLRVRIEIIGLVAVRGPGVTAEIDVKRRKHRRILSVRYDGISRTWSGLRCDGCGASTSAFALCDEAAHVLCASCWNVCGTGGHRPCFRCAGKPERNPGTAT